MLILFKDLIRTEINEVIWIGFSDADEEGTYQWLDGSRVSQTLTEKRAVA